MFGQRRKGSTGAHQENVAPRGKRKGKAPEVGAAGRVSEQGREGEIGEWVGVAMEQGLVSHERRLNFTLNTL